MRLLKWLLFAAALVALLSVAAAFLLQQWINGSDVRSRAEREASRALGVPVRVGRLSVNLLPLPGLAADQVQLQTRPALAFGRLEARPNWTRLLHGELQVGTLVVRQAELPQQAMGAIIFVLQERPAQSRPLGRASTAALWPQTIVLDEIAFVNAQGQRMTVDAQAQLASDGRLESGSLNIRDGRLAGTAATLGHANGAWPLQVNIAGGSIQGSLKLQPGRNGLQVLEGQLRTDGVDLAQLTAPNRTLTGKLEGETRLRSEYRDPAALVDALKTESHFAVREPVLGLDLARAATSPGPMHGGSTRLDTLTSDVLTQGRAVRLSKLAANSGALAAHGDVSMSPEQTLSGRISVDLAKGLGGFAVPLAIGGTVDAPSVSLAGGAPGIANALALRGSR